MTNAFRETLWRQVPVVRSQSVLQFWLCNEWWKGRGQARVEAAGFRIRAKIKGNIRNGSFKLTYAIAMQLPNAHQQMISTAACNKQMEWKLTNTFRMDMSFLKISLVSKRRPSMAGNSMEGLKAFTGTTQRPPTGGRKVFCPSLPVGRVFLCKVIQRRCQWKIFHLKPLSLIVFLLGMLGAKPLHISGQPGKSRDFKVPTWTRNVLRWQPLRLRGNMVHILK